jgi:hypothetical protein
MTVMSYNHAIPLLKAVLLISLLLSLGACDIGRWQLMDDRSGRILRLDRWRGEVAVVNGDRLTALKEPAPIAVAAKAKSWRELELPALGHSKASLTTSWRRDELHYRFSLRPPPAITNDGKTVDQVILEFHDDGGFELFAVIVPLKRMAALVDNKGDVVAREMNSSLPLNYEEYELASRWQVAWNAPPPK